MEMTDAIKLLAIDDNPDNLTTLSAVVREALPQSRVLTATNGPAGIELAAAEDPDVILLDIVMPGMDGFEVCRRLKADERIKDIPVVFLTALKTDAASRVKALEVGAEGFLAKPLETAELTAQIRAMTKIKAANRSQRQEKDRLEALVAERTADLRGTLAIMQKNADQLRLQAQIIENSPVIAAYHDKDLNMIWANKAYQKATGLSLEEISGKKCYQVWNLAKPCRGCPVITAIESGENAAAELTPDNQYNWPQSQGYWLSQAAPVRNEQGAIIGAIEFAIDISERKQVERDLLESKALIDAVVENIPLMLFLKKAEDLSFVLFNRAGEELVGYDRKDFLGKNALDLFPPEQAAHFMAEDREVLTSGVALDLPEEPIATAKKGTRLLHTRKVCIRGADGAKKYLLGISDDITARKETEKKIAEQLHELQRWHNVMLDREGRIIELKREVNELLAKAGEPLRYESAVEEEE